MSTPHELLDAYAAEFGGLNAYEEERARGGCAPAAFDALRAVLDIHEPYQVLDSGTPDCHACSAHSDIPEPWPCQTVQAITNALEGTI